VKKDQALHFLSKLFVKVSTDQSRGTWTESECPLQPWKHDQGKSSPKVFGIRVEEGDSLTKCFACGWAGSQLDLLVRLKQLNSKEHAHNYPFGELTQMVYDAEANAEFDPDEIGIEELLSQKKEPLHEFPEWWLESFTPYHASQDALAYLAQRQVPECIAEALDLRYDSAQRRLCFPVRDFNGMLVGLHGRALDEDTEPRYRMYRYAKKNNPLVWLGEHWLDPNKPVIAVEGPFDLAQTVRVFRNTVTPLFAVPGLDKMKRMGDVLTWGTLLDRGTGGNQGRVRFTQAYPDAHITHLLPPDHCKDPGAMTVQELAEVIGEHFDLDDLVLD
jgi:hypothetical protein